MWASQEIVPLLEVSTWLTHGLYVVIALCGLAGLYSLKKP